MILKRLNIILHPIIIIVINLRNKMEGLIKQDNNQTLATATEIIKKFKSLQDRINFCLEKNWHHPREIGFDATTITAEDVEKYGL